MSVPNNKRGNDLDYLLVCAKNLSRRIEALEHLTGISNARAQYEADVVREEHGAEQLTMREVMSRMRTLKPCPVREERDLLAQIVTDWVEGNTPDISPKTAAMAWYEQKKRKSEFTFFETKFMKPETDSDV